MEGGEWKYFGGGKSSRIGGEAAEKKPTATFREQKKTQLPEMHKKRDIGH